MTLLRTKSGIFECDFRAKGMERLHLSLRTKVKKKAQARHDAVGKVYRQRRHEMIAQLRTGELPVERLESMVEHHEPLAPVAMPVAVVAVEPTAPLWEAVDEASVRYLGVMDARARANGSDQTAKLAVHQLTRFRDYEYEGTRIGSMPLDGVPSAAVLAYQKWMIDAEVPVNTITTYMSRVSALWTWAIEDEAWGAREQKRQRRDLFSPVKRDQIIRDVQRRERMLTKEEALRLMAATPAQYRFAVACGVLGGLRIGEVLHLRPAIDVDLEIGTLTIRKQQHWKPKTKRSARVVPMAELLLQCAKDHAAAFASTAWMYPSPVIPGEPLTQLGFRKHFKSVVKRAGLLYGRDDVQGLTFHTLRHTFASHAVMRGVDLYTVAQLIGDSLETVESTYAHLSPDFKRAAMRKLEGVFNLAAENDTAGDTENAAD